MSTTLINLLPLLAALLYGLAYAIVARGFPNVNAATFAVLEGLAYASIPLAVAYGKPYGPSLTQLLQADAKSLILVAIAVACAATALMITTIVIKNVSPTYAAIGEVGYIVLTPLFVWLLFNVKDFNAYTLAGAAVVLAGFAIVFYGQQTHTVIEGVTDARL